MNTIYTACANRFDLLGLQLRSLQKFCKDEYEHITYCTSAKYASEIKEMCDRNGSSFIQIKIGPWREVDTDVFEYLRQYSAGSTGYGMFLHDDVFAVKLFSFSDYPDKSARYYCEVPHTAIQIWKGDYPNFETAHEISSGRPKFNRGNPLGLDHLFFDYDVDWGMEIFNNDEWIHYDKGSGQHPCPLLEDKDRFTQKIMDYLELGELGTSPRWCVETSENVLTKQREEHARRIELEQIRTGPCTHRGGRLEKVECLPCSQRSGETKMVQIHSCEVYEKCSLTIDVPESKQTCISCTEHEVPDETVTS